MSLEKTKQIAKGKNLRQFKVRTAKKPQLTTQDFSLLHYALDLTAIEYTEYKGPLDPLNRPEPRRVRMSRKIRLLCEKLFQIEREQRNAK